MSDQTKVVNIDLSGNLKGLNNRRALAKMCIYELDHMTDGEVEAKGFTPEQKIKAMEKYKKQLASIEKKIEALTGTPPPVVVGLKTAKLFGEARNIK